MRLTVTVNFDPFGIIGAVDVDGTISSHGLFCDKLKTIFIAALLIFCIGFVGVEQGTQEITVEAESSVRFLERI